MIELNDKIAEHEVELAKLKKQREAYGKANPKSEEGTIIATSTKEGFVWNCNTDGNSIVRHAVRTLKTAIKSLNTESNTEMHKVMLGIGIMEVIRDLAKEEGNK